MEIKGKKYYTWTKQNRYDMIISVKVVLITGKSIREFSGRAFSLEDIEQIKWMRKTYKHLSESELASTICESIGWLTPSGMPKTVQCVQYLRLLGSEGEINLPESQSRVGKVSENRKTKAAERAAKLPEIADEIREISGASLEIAEPGMRLQLLRAYMKRYHILGDGMVFGDRLYYFITDEGKRELGCMRFSASSWALEDRERWIGWDSKQRKERLFLIVNQSRFLIFPWVRVKNLASKVLAMAARRIPSDWLSRYCYEPVLLETFVERERFKGTSYKAANWELIGETKGRGRNGRKNEHTLSVKDIYMYPLRRDFRAVLKGEKPYKTVDPNE